MARRSNPRSAKARQKAEIAAASGAPASPFLQRGLAFFDPLDDANNGQDDSASGLADAGHRRGVSR